MKIKAKESSMKYFDISLILMLHICCAFSLNHGLTEKAHRHSARSRDLRIGDSHPSKHSGSHYKTSYTRIHSSSEENVILSDLEKRMAIIKDFSRQEGGWQDVLAAVEEMRVAGIPLNQHIYHAAMQTCCNQGQATKALELFDMMKKEAISNGTHKKASGPDKFCYDVAISACRRLKQPQRALNLLEEMMSFGDTFSPSMYTYNEVFRAFRGIRNGLAQVDKLLPVLLARQKGGGNAPRSLSVCLNLLWIMADEGSWRRSLVLMNDMIDQGVYPDKECYEAAIYGCVKGGAWREATRLLDQQRFEGNKHIQVKPDEFSFRLTILACSTESLAKGPNSEEALGRGLIALKQMREEVKEINAKEMLEVYKQLINACVANRKQWNRALDLFNQMKTTCKGVTIPGPIYRSMIHILSNSSGNRWKESYALLTEAREKKRNLTTVTYNSVIRMLCKDGELDLAYDVFRQMRQNSKMPGVDSYNQLLDGCAKMGDWRKALALLEEMNLDNIQPDLYSYRATIGALANGKEWEKGLALVARMARSGLQPNIHCYNAALLGCAKAGALEGAWERAQAMVEVMKREGPAPDVYTFNALIEAYSRGRKYKLAMNQLNVMEQLGIKPDMYTYGNLINACKKDGNCEVALDIIQSMRDKAIQPNLVCYTAAMGVMAQAGRGDLAEQLLREMNYDGIVPSVITFTLAITAAARCRNMSQALRVREVMKRNGIKPDLMTYTALIGTCAKTQTCQMVYELLDEMSAEGLKPNVHTYSATMNAFNMCDRYEESLEFYRKMKADDISLGQSAYSLAIEAYEKMGRSHAAVELTNEMLQAGFSLPVKDVEDFNEWE